MTGWHLAECRRETGSGTLTSTTAWRYWKWDPSNDRDFTGLSVLSNRRQHQSTVSGRRKFAMQAIFYPTSAASSACLRSPEFDTDPFHIESQEQTSGAFRRAQRMQNEQSGLFDGLELNTFFTNTFSGAAFDNLIGVITERLHLLADFDIITIIRKLTSTGKHMVALKQQIPI